MNARTPAPTSRNAPCPCGSGRRYKDCHGVVGGGPAPVERPARGAYRPDGPDWDALPEARRVSLAMAMEDALALQNAGNDEAAARLYESVLEAAPETHDALHMLGVSNWRMGELRRAFTLVSRARALRPPYPSIDKNLRSIVWTLESRAVRGREKLSVSALRLICGLLSPEGEPFPSTAALAPREKGEPLHLILGTPDSTGDADWIFRRLHALLAPWGVTAWSADAPIGTSGIRRIDASLCAYPTGGVQIHVGLDLDHDTWLARAEPRRVVAIGVRADASAWLTGLRRLAQDGAVPLLPVFLTGRQAQPFGLDGPVLTLPPWADEAIEPRPYDAWTLGYVGDGLRLPKSSADEACLRQLDEAGIPVAVRDLGHLRFTLGDRRGIRFEARTARSLSSFVASVDALLVPERPWQREGVQPEIAMARTWNRPVIVPSSSIHAPPVAGAAGMHVVADAAQAARVALELRQRGRAKSVSAAFRRDAADVEDVRAMLDAILHLGPRESAR